MPILSDEAYHAKNRDCTGPHQNRHVYRGKRKNDIPHTFNTLTYVYLQGMACRIITECEALIPPAARFASFSSRGPADDQLGLTGVFGIQAQDSISSRLIW
jgi:hypothetical protein